MKYGEELKQSIIEERNHICELIEERQKHINACDYDYDDCFVSDHIDHDKIRECDLQLNILSGDGCMDYEAIFDENGKEVRTNWFANKWGGFTIVGRGIFASSEKALLKKTGWTKKTIRVPVWTKFCSCGSGMAGVCQGSTEVVRWHTNMVTGKYVGYPE